MEPDTTPALVPEFDNRLFGPIELLNKAWNIFAGRFWVLIGTLFVPILLSLAFFLPLFLLSALGVGLIKTQPAIFIGLVGFVYLLFMISMIYLQSWSQLAFIAAVSRATERLGFKAAFALARPKIWKYFWTMLLMVLIFLPLSLFFFIPGLIFLVFAGQAFFILADEDVWGMDALLKSREYVRGRFWSLVGRYLAIMIIFLVIMFLVVLATIIARAFSPLLGFIVNIAGSLISPLVMIWSYLLYRNLRELKGQFSFQPSGSAKTWWRIFSIAGIVIFILIISGPALLLAINPSQQLSRARDTQRQMDLQILKKQIDTFYVTTGHYPANLNLLVPAYLKTLPQDPRTRRDYEYAAANNIYQLCGYLESGPADCLGPNPPAVSPTSIPILPVSPTNPSASVHPQTSKAPAPKPTSVSVSAFTSLGTQNLETGITANMLSLTRSGEKMVATYSFKNTGSVSQDVLTYRISMYSQKFGGPGNPLASFTLAPGASRQFTVTYDPLPEPPPYIFRYAGIGSGPSVTLGIFSPWKNILDYL